MRDGVPPAERRDMQAEFVRQALGGATRGDFLPHDAVDEMILWSQSPDIAAKAITLTPTTWRPAAALSRDRGHQAVLYLGERGVMGPGRPEPWRSKPMSGGLEFLKWIGEHDMIHRSIVAVCKREARPYLKRYRENNPAPVGYRLSRTDGERMSKDDEHEAEPFYGFLEHCGTEDDPVEREALDRKTLPEFVDQLLDDSLTMDAAPIEIEQAFNGKPLGFYNVAGDTVRKCYEDGYLDDDRIVYVQLDPWTRQPVIGFERGEISYPMRNPRPGLERGGYGHAELEDITRVISAFFSTFTFNAASTDRRQMPRGFLQLFGDFNARTLSFFQQQWGAQFTGPANAWLLPILAARDKQTGGAQFVKIDDGLNEMALSKWLIFLVSLHCAPYGMDPSLINMESFSARSSSLSGNDTEAKIQKSRDLGRIPRMEFLQQVLNDQLLRRLTKKFALDWIGLYPEDEERKAERLKLVARVNEVRAIDGMEALTGVLGEAPVNPTLLGLYMTEQGIGGGQGDQGNQGGNDPHFGLPGSERPLLPKTDNAPGPGGAERGGNAMEAGARRLERGAAKGVLTVEIRELGPDWADAS